MSNYCKSSTEASRWMIWIFVFYYFKCRSPITSTWWPLFLSLFSLHIAVCFFTFKYFEILHCSCAYSTISCDTLDHLMWPLYVSFLIFSFAKYSFFITWNTKFKLTNMDKLSMRCIFYSHFQFTHFRVDRLWSWRRREAWCFLWTDPAPQPLALWRPRWCSSALVPTLQDRPPFTAPRLTRCSIWGECCSIVSQECLVSGICWLSLSMKCWFTLSGK